MTHHAAPIWQYLNDSSLKNVHWAVCTGIFGKRDVGRIEREFLDVLDFELSISEDDIMAHHDTIMSLVAPARHHSSHGIPSVPLPELGYPSGSPTSTEASFSPRTPPTLVENSMDVEPSTKSALHVRQAQYGPYPVAPVQAHVSQPRHEKRSSHASSTFRILRSFPFPRSFGHSSSSSSSSSSSASRNELQVPSQGITQQGRCQLLAPFAAQPSTQVYA